MNLDRYGNTSIASAFIALWEAFDRGRLRPGMRVLFLAFGAAFTWVARSERLLGSGHNPTIQTIDNISSLRNLCVPSSEASHLKREADVKNP